MNKLRAYVLKLFIACSLSLVFFDALWTQSFERWIMPSLERWLGLALVLMLLGDLLILFGSAAVFYHFLSRRLNRIQTQEKKEHFLLFANIAHDLKTPMTSIYGYSNALRDGVVPEAERATVYEKMSRKTREANELLDLVFTYSQNVSGGRDWPQQKLDPAPVLREVLAAHYDELEEQGIVVEAEIPAESEPVLIYRDELKRILDNLLINTYRHNPAGTQVKITLESGVIRMEDDGTELSAERFEELKKPFTRADETRSTPGNGLGLAICDSILERYHYSLRLQALPKPQSKAIELRLIP